MINAKAKYLIEKAGGATKSAKILGITRQTVDSWKKKRGTNREGKLFTLAEMFGFNGGDFIRKEKFHQEWRVFESLELLTDKELIEKYGFDENEKIYHINCHNICLYYQVLAS